MAAKYCQNVEVHYVFEEKDRDSTEKKKPFFLKLFLDGLVFIILIVHGECKSESPLFPLSSPIPR
jgi:hypothetical protein